MSFEIQYICGENNLLSPVDSGLEPGVGWPSTDKDFIDPKGRGYSGFFDGSNVIFSDGIANYIGQWLQGTSATVIRRTRLLPRGFTFTFMDHGCAPQRLHAVWDFDGPQGDTIDAWKLAGFCVSSVDRHVNRNHPGSSIHLRTKGAFITGADSSHVVISSVQAEKCTTGEIHVGEFNPYRGLGIGFVLHQLEGRSSFTWRK